MCSAEDSPQGPDLSVVVIVHNDAARLPNAVDSVLGQTLRSVEIVIVDDCSTDNSYSVAQEFTTAHPDRVRAFQLPVNSGACGEPRNLGIGKCRGRYVMFLDSDDVLERNACRNMLEAAERTGADLVSGLCVRQVMDARGKKPDEWYGWLYGRTRTLDSVSELPDLFAWDTLCTNKCYRRAFLEENRLRFPKGIFYEDLLFVAEAYLAARCITLVPNKVYTWRIYEHAPVKSVTRRRHELTNLENRLEIHRRIDVLLSEHGHTALKRAKDVKFLKHDLVLHLRDLPRVDDAYRRRFVELAGGYLATIDADAHRQVQPPLAVCAALLSGGDLDNLLPAADALVNPGTIATPLVERDGRIYWCAEHLDDPESRRTLDVTDLGHHTLPLSALRLRNRLTAYAQEGPGAVRLAGSIVNPLGRITPGAHLSGHLELRARRRTLQTFRFPLGTLRHAGELIDWAARIDLARRLRPLGLADVVWDVCLVLDVDGERVLTRLSTGGLPVDRGGRVRVRPRLTRLVADRVEPRISRYGHLTFAVVAQGPAAVRGREFLKRSWNGRPGDLTKAGVRRARQVIRWSGSGETKIRVYHKVLSRLPVRKGLVVFESHLGKQYSDSPRAIYEEMRRQGIRFRPVWSYAGELPEGFPADATLVRRWSWPYLRALAQAEFWIDNQGFPLKLRKRPGTTYLQTWHGSALKRMGFDEPATAVLGRRAREEHQRALDRFDHFLVRSEHDVCTLAKAFRLRAEVLLRAGYPRNDALVAARRRETETGVRERGPLAAELGIPADRQVLLYAPTFRTTTGGRASAFEMPFDVEEFARRFGDRYTLLVRAHYLNQVVLPPSTGGAVLDVSHLHDVTPLLSLADALITDYSSLMFDYALLDRPMLFHAYDWEEYAGRTRGTYFDLRDKAPGPVTESQDDLFAMLGHLMTVQTHYAQARQYFVKEFGEHDQGHAARTVVNTLFATAGGTR